MLSNPQPWVLVICSIDRKAEMSRPRLITLAICTTTVGRVQWLWVIRKVSSWITRSYSWYRVKIQGWKRGRSSWRSTKMRWNGCKGGHVRLRHALVTAVLVFGKGIDHWRTREISARRWKNQERRRATKLSRTALPCFEHWSTCGSRPANVFIRVVKIAL